MRTLRLRVRFIVVYECIKRKKVLEVGNSQTLVHGYDTTKNQVIKSLDKEEHGHLSLMVELEGHRSVPTRTGIGTRKSSHLDIYRKFEDSFSQCAVFCTSYSSSYNPWQSCFHIHLPNHNQCYPPS